ncbi:hypothetical protein LJB93_01190 [Desulfovibrio sp. OttesenSCG-928-F07]|nr:hypothetical protein [Desulfovibrio sp. OttesenSCG-928-F07]
MSDTYREIARKIEEADYILIGAGAGLSATSTIDYVDPEEFKASFPYLAKLGVKTRWEAAWYKYPSAEAHWAFWAKHILQVRFDAPAGEAYLNLLELVKEKPWFVISTNVDHQFIKAGFDKSKVFTTQGNYGYFQCALPCRQEVWDNEQILRNMAANINEDSFEIRTCDIPRCKFCGGMVALNLRSGDNFVEDIWMQQSEPYGEFIQKGSKSQKFLLMEFGIGFNTPSIIRYPFEWYTKYYAGAELIRFNTHNPEVPDSIKAKSVSVTEDINEALKAILAERAILRGRHD